MNVQLAVWRVAPWVVAVLTTASVQAASFDCAKAQTRVEKLICDSPKLSKLDEEMAVIYGKAQLRSPVTSDLKKEQLLWVSARNLCPDTECVQDAYVKRLSALQVDAQTANVKVQPASAGPSNPGVIPCMSVDECRLNPVRMETLGANWQYKRDADKLPAIRNALASGKLKAPEYQVVTGYKNFEFCAAFKEDFLKGRNVQAIEPDYEILSVDDQRLEKWMNPKDCPDNDDAKRDSVFLSLGLNGVPPYRFYRLELDGNKTNGKEDVVLYRSAGNGYWQHYDWVDLKQCLIRDARQVSSPKERSNMENRDALGLLISYRGLPMVLEYSDWARQGDLETNGSDVTLIGFNLSGVCSWGEPLRPPSK